MKVFARRTLFVWADLEEDLSRHPERDQGTAAGTSASLVLQQHCEGPGKCQVRSPSPAEGCAPSPLWGGFVWGLPPAARQRCAQYRRMSLWTWRRSSERVPSPPRRRHGEISPGQPCSQPEAGVCYLPTEGSLTRMRARLLQQDWVLRYWRISSAFLKLSPSIME